MPLLGISTAALAGHLHLAAGFEWLGTWPAFACFLTATVVEVVAYYVPWLDNLLDTIATPGAVVAGTIAMASVVTDMSPLMQWTLALIAGGGTAGVIQSATVVVRGTSTASTGGLTNWLIATTELIASTCATVLSILLPILAVLLAGLVLLISLSIVVRRTRRTKLRLSRDEKAGSAGASPSRPAR